jgi:hypothetical protein
MQCRICHSDDGEKDLNQLCNNCYGFQQMLKARGTTIDELHNEYRRIGDGLQKLWHASESAEQEIKGQNELLRQTVDDLRQSLLAYEITPNGSLEAIEKLIDETVDERIAQAKQRIEEEAIKKIRSPSKLKNWWV